MAVSFSGTFSTPFYTGGATTSLVPHKWDVAIAGRGYMLDRKRMEETPLFSSIRSTRTQSDGSNEPGEQSLNPDDLWRRSQQTWHLGAGQDYLDRDDSLRSRFRRSKGINPWVRGEISLLNATIESLNSANTNLLLMPAGSRLYVADGTALKYTTNLTSYSTTTGTSGVAITGIASDGFNVWVTDGSNVYKTDTSSTSASSWSTEDADVLGYVKGRLMFSDGPEIGYFSNMVTPTATSLFTHASSTFTFVGFAEGPTHIYTAGYSGDKSLIYRIAITAEGTSLGAPTVAGELPDGEQISSIGSYLGFIFLGTSKGARFCTHDSQGNLTIGKLLATPNPVNGFEGQGEFVWFGWTNYDGISTGLGRISLRNFASVESLEPAYASDLMVDTQASVLGVCTFLNRRVFSVSGDGVYAEDTAKLVASGTLDSGYIRWGISEQKIPLYLDIACKATFAGTIQAYAAMDGEKSYTLMGTHTSSAQNTINDTFPLGQDPADQVEVRLVLSRDGSTTSTGPTLLRYTVRVQPVPNIRTRIVLPLLLFESVETNAKTTERVDVAFELGSISGLRSSKQVVAVQVGSELYAATVEDFDHLAFGPTRDRSAWNGTLIAQFKTV